MTSRPAAPESETPETDAMTYAKGAKCEWHAWAHLSRKNGAIPLDHEIEAYNMVEFARSLERRLSLAQTEIKGHMRIEDDLKRDLEEMTISNRYHAEDSLKHLHRAEAAEGRIAELEKDAARYRWLRLHAKDRNVWQPINAPEMFDAAIDAALKDRA